MKDLNCEEKNIWWKNFILEVSDGHTLHLTSIPFQSAERSRKQLDSTVKSAKNVIRRSPESNDKGEQVGERALGFFPEIKESKPPWGVAHYKVIWTWGSNYWEITGEHLDDVLALEQRLNEEGVGAVWGWRGHGPWAPSS